MSKPTFALSQDSRVIAARLQQLQPGQVVAYEELARAVGMSWGDRKDRETIRSRISTARSVVLRDHGIATGAVIGEGIKRLVPSEIAGIGTHAVQHINRTARRSTKQMLQAAGRAEMTSAEQRELNTSLSVLGALSLFSGTKAVTKIDAAVRAGGGELAVGNTLALFANGGAS